MISMRRLYADIIQGRTTVRIMPAPVSRSTQQPVFIVSPYRSGSTLLRLILDSHSHLAAPPEMALFGHIHELLADERALSGFQGLGFDRTHVISKLTDYTSYFYEAYAESVGKRRWVDKSPEHAFYLPLIYEMYPDARFIMLSRYPLDQIESMVSSSAAFAETLSLYTKSPTDDLRLAGARYWNAVVDRQFCFETRHPDACIRVRYEDICNDPEKEIQRLITFIGLEWEQDIIQSSKFHHDFGMSDDKARSSRGITLSTGHFMTWGSATIEACLQITEQNRVRLNWGSSTPEKGSEPSS